MSEEKSASSLKKIEIKKAFSYGWNTVKGDFWYFVGLASLYLVLSNLFTYLPKKYDDIASILSTILSAFLVCGLLKILLNYYDGEKAKLVSMFDHGKYFLRVLGAQILIILITFAGLCLLIVPGLIWALRYQFVINLIVDKDMGIREAMAESARLTHGVKWRLLLFDLALTGIVILGAIALGVGILVAFPVVYLAEIYVYRKLLESK